MPSIEHPNFNQLSPDQLKVYTLLQQGLSNKEIATKLGLGISGVTFHITNITRITKESRSAIAAGSKSEQLPTVTSALQDLQLSDTQQKIAKLMLQNKSDQEIAKRLGMSVKGVRYHKTIISNAVLPPQEGISRKKPMVIVALIKRMFPS